MKLGDETNNLSKETRIIMVYWPPRSLPKCEQYILSPLDSEIVMSSQGNAH